MTANEEKPAGTAITWSAHPARERPRAAMASVVIIAMLAVCAAWLGGSYLWGLLAGFVLMLSLSRFFFPSQFTIDDEGITARYPLTRKRMLWKDLRRFLHDANGGYLSSRTRPSRFDAYRGMHLLFGAEHKKVVSEIERHLKTEVAPAQSERQPGTGSRQPGEDADVNLRIAAEGGAR